MASIRGEASAQLDAPLKTGGRRSVVELMLPALLEQLVHHQRVGGLLGVAIVTLLMQHTFILSI